MIFDLKNFRDRFAKELPSFSHLCKLLISTIFVSLSLNSCALTRSPRLDEPEPFKPNLSSIEEPLRSALSLIPLNLDLKNKEDSQIEMSSTSGENTKMDVASTEDKPLPLVYRLRVSEPIRSQLKFPKNPVMLAAMKSCGKISDSSRNEGFVRQLFVGWKGAQGVSVRSLEIQGQRLAIAKGHGEIAGAPVALFALTRRSGSCVYDLTIWSEDQSLLEISSEAISALGLALLGSQG